MMMMDDIAIWIALALLFFFTIWISVVARKRTKAKMREAIMLFLDAVLAILFIPLAIVIPKKKNLVLFMGRFMSGFMDNVKYLYLYLYDHGYEENYDIVFVGYRDKVLPEMDAKGYQTISFPSLKAYWMILRARVIITDNAHWTTHNRYHAAFRAKKVQLWHGIGFKKIRLTDENFVAKSKGFTGFFKYKLEGQLAIYDTFVSTSQFFSDQVFIPSFLPKEAVSLGYPRNDILFENTKFGIDGMQINVDTSMLEEVIRRKQQGKKIVLYSPTFRNSKNYEISSRVLNFRKLSEFGAEHNIVFVFKLHPLPNYKIDFSLYANIIEYDSKMDVYPAFKYVDMLITDYSSIYMDFLLLDRPCLFFMYDYDHYTSNCRDLRTDLIELTPGEKCYTEKEMKQAVYSTLILGEDPYQEERRRVRDLSWAFQDGYSSKRVWEYIESKYLQSSIPDSRKLETQGGR